MNRSLEYDLMLAERNWPGLVFKRKTAIEAAGPCPKCQGDDRFLLSNGMFWCRQCHYGGVLKHPDTVLSESERVELRLRALEREQAEQSRWIDAHERMHQEVALAKHYHANLDEVPGARDWWERRGIWPATQDIYELGWCARCPTDKLGRMAYTIPIYQNDKLENIRYRLELAPGDMGGKYRPHLAGLGLQLFNSDWLTSSSTDRGEGTQLPTDEIILGEGECKAIVASQWGFPTVAIMGKTGWRTEWLSQFDRISRIHVCLDPDAKKDEADAIAQQFGSRGWVLWLPVKLDDFFSIHGGTPADLKSFLRWSRPWQKTN